MVTEAFLQIATEMKKFGLSLGESKVYLSTVVLSAPTASEIASFSGVPRTKVYPILKKLERDGLVNKMPEKIAKFVGKDFKSFCNDRAGFFEKQANEMKRLHEAVEKNIKLLNPRKLDEKAISILLLRGRKAVFKKNRELVLNAKEDVRIITTSSGIAKINSFLGRGIYSALGDASVRTTILLPVESWNTRICLEIPPFVQVRSIKPFSSAHIFIRDQKEMCMSESSGEKNFPTAFWTDDAEFVKIFIRLFDVLREQASDIPGRVEVVRI